MKQFSRKEVACSNYWLVTPVLMCTDISPRVIPSRDSSSLTFNH